MLYQEVRCSSPSPSIIVGARIFDLSQGQEASRVHRRLIALSFHEAPERLGHRWRKSGRDALKPSLLCNAFRYDWEKVVR